MKTPREMMRYIIYGIYNIAYQLLSLFLLFYAFVYINGLFIPDSFMWHNGKLRGDLTLYTMANLGIAIIEGALLMLPIYQVNKSYLTGVARANLPQKIARYTAGVYALVTIALLFFVAYSILK
jgi:hypothetical protein